MEKECAMGNGANIPDFGGFSKSFSIFDGGRGGGGGGGGSGPTSGSNCGGANEVQLLLGDHITTQRRDEYILSSSSSSSPFHIFNSTGEMVAFTSSQWRELERQAMIYKYMISSLPVPPHLLYPSSSPMNISLYNVGYTKNGVAVEPGRCKRTDGKKWRCSRDVALHQKYCERHLHRGRPRSRKPVELHLNINGDHEKLKKPRLQQTKHLVTHPSITHDDDESLPLFNAKSDLSYIKGTNRDLGSMTRENEMVAANEAGQKWLESDMGFGNSICGGSNSRFPYHQESDRVLTYSDYPASEMDPPVGFIDAWSDCNSSIGNLGGPTLPIGHESFSPSLSLSIGGSGFDGEMGSAQACDGGVGFYSEESRWPGSPVCWGAFGGPLAEALCANPLASPRDSIGGVATNVSSPSGVIQRTLFSHSGGSSVCNSPSEMGFQRIK